MEGKTPLFADESAAMARPKLGFDGLPLVHAAKVTAKAFRSEGKDQKQYHDDSALKDSQRQRISEVIAQQIFDRDRG
jgi:hypothetical protein